MEPTKMRLRARKKTGSDKALQAMTAEASPDSKCPICLDRFNNMAYLDRCLHKFCFRCIHEWSKNKAECPLCKQGFNSIFHTIKAENDFKEFVLRPVENGSFGGLGGHRFRYRTTLTRERQQARRITSPPPDNGVIFEGLGTAAASQPDRGVRRMMTRLAARRRAQSEGRTLRTLREQEMIHFRRALYRAGVRVRNVRDGGRYRDTTAEFYQRNPACLHRLVPWLKRELTVLYGAHGSLVNIVQHIIMSWITRYDMEDQAMQEELRPFLLARTDHFLHEFISFARAPFNLEAYDQHAVYDCPAPSSLEDSGSDASVIAISEDEDELDQQGGPVVGSALSQAPWDDETPGPSYSTTANAPLAVSESESESGAEERARPGDTLQQGAQVKMDPAAAMGGAHSSGEDDCVIIGYVKPMVERTPELVKLSSDSEESVLNESPEAFAQPQHICFHSLSPPSSIGSMGSKPKSPTQGQVHSQERPEAKDNNHTSAPSDFRPPSSPWGSPPPDLCKISKEMDPKIGKNQRTDRCDDSKRHRKQDGSRKTQKSRSREECPLDRTRRRSRSPTISIKSDSTHSRGMGRSRSRSRERQPSIGGVRDERRGRDGSGSRRGYEKRSRLHRRDSRSRYTRERECVYAPFSESRSRYASNPGNSESWRLSCSRSKTGPNHRDRRRSRSPSSASSPTSHSAHRSSRHDKPGGKRKYKTRHLEDSARDRSPGLQSPSSHSSTVCAKEKRPSGEKHHMRSQGKSRSSSVEIVYEGRATGERRRRHKKRKKHKKKSRRRKAQEPAEHSSPIVITINSDSDHSADAETAPFDLRCPESSDEASSPPSNPGMVCWEGQTQPVSQGSNVDILNDGAAYTADDTKHNVPISISEQTPTLPKDETDTSSIPKICTESHLLSCL